MLDNKVHQDVFSKLRDSELSALEKELAYFFGAKEIEEISKHYIKALEILEEEGGISSEETLKEKMIYSLKKAYNAVADQIELHFDTFRAAEFEAELIVAQWKKESFENLQNILENVYITVFNCEREKVTKASMLRTFLYKYKIYLLNSEKPLSIVDKELLIKMAKESERILNQLKYF